MTSKSILIIPSLFLFHSVLAQEKGDAIHQPTSLTPYYPEEKLDSKKARKRNASKTTVDLQREYYEREEAVMKERRRAERLMLKPQYSDPMYFGHKRPPKKHSPAKMKLCKECGIRH